MELKTMGNTILGLDIRDDNISAVLVSGGNKGGLVEAFLNISRADVESQLQDEAEPEGSNHAGQNAETVGHPFSPWVGRAFELIAEQLDLSGSRCVASFPADRISFRYISIPFQNVKKIRQVLPFELEPELPFPADELVIDFQVLSLPVQAGHTPLFAACAADAVLRPYVEMMKGSGIEPYIIVPGGVYPAAMYLSRCFDHDTLLFVDIGKSKCCFCMSASRQILLLRSFPLSSDIRSISDQVCAGIKRTLLAFNHKFDSDYQPDKIFVTVCEVEDDDLIKKMTDNLGGDVQRVDMANLPKGDITMAPSLAWDPGRMNHALALTLPEISGINGLTLYKSAFAAKRILAENRKLLWVTGVLSGLILVLFLLNVFLDFRIMHNKINNLDYQIATLFQATFPEVTRIVDPLQQMKVKIKELQKEAVITDESGGNLLKIDILNEISRRIPRQLDVKFSRLSIGSGSLLISGETKDFNAVDDVKNRLESFDGFKSVEISSATTDKSGNQILFKLKIEL